MGTVRTVLLVALLAILVTYTSLKLLIMLAIMAFGSAIATLIEKGRDEFSLGIVFHKCCSTAQWAFISYYLFGMEHLTSLRMQYAFGAMIAISGLLYVVTAVNTRQIVEGPDPRPFSTGTQKMNAIIALITLLAMVGFSYYLERYALGPPF